MLEILKICCPNAISYYLSNTHFK